MGLAAYARGAPQGVPNKVIEYMAAGLAVVTSLSGETREIIDRGTAVAASTIQPAMPQLSQKCCGTAPRQGIYLLSKANGRVRILSGLTMLRKCLSVWPRTWNRLAADMASGARK